MANYVVCGILHNGVGYSDIVCNPATGECIFVDDVNGNCVLSNVSVKDPMDFTGQEISTRNLGSYQGMILTNSYVIYLTSDKAFYFEYPVDPEHPKYSVEYDTNIQCDETIEY